MTTQAGVVTETFVAAARGYVGVPWRHLGRSRTGVDCIGLVLLAARETAALAPLLVLHLALVLALFLTLPYGKFAHGLYRAAALLKWSIEKRQPNRLGLGGE